VICQAECDEVRFDFDSVFTGQGAIPQEYFGTYSEWIPLPNQSIVCYDEEYSDDVVVYDDLITSPAVETNETLTFNTTLATQTASSNKTHEMLLDEVLLNVQTIQNNQTTNNKTKEEIEDELIKTENEYIMLKILEHTEETRMKAIRDSLLNQTSVSPRPTTTPVSISTTTSSTPSFTSTTVSNDENEDEDKYILSMVFEFSQFDKRNARPTDMN